MMLVVDKMLKCMQVMKLGLELMRLIYGGRKINFASSCEIWHDHADWERGG